MHNKEESESNMKNGGGDHGNGGNYGGHGEGGGDARVRKEFEATGDMGWTDLQYMQQS